MKTILMSVVVVAVMAVAVFALTTGETAKDEEVGDGLRYRIQDEASAPVVEPVIGGQRDEYGCLGPAGYSWDNAVLGCVRLWELDEDQRRAAGAAIRSLDPERVFTVISAEKGDCEGCYAVQVTGQDNAEPMTVMIENWLAVTPTEGR